MTKEEYLNMYKEDKLAEICAQFEEKCEKIDKEKEYYHGEVIHVKKLCNELSEYWENTDKLFEKLKTIPAKDFIELYYQMKEVIENKATNKNTTYIPDQNNWGSITTAISSR